MDLMSVRRGLMAIPFDTGYITDGLVLRLDGIDKGVNAGAWTDLVGGHIFQAFNGVTFESNHILLDGSTGYLVNDSFTPPPAATSTIEVVHDKTKTGNSMVFIAKTGRHLSYGFYQSGTSVIYGNNYNARYPQVLSVPSMGAISINVNVAILNGQVGTTGGADYWSSADSTYNVIGSRGNRTGAFFGGKIYTIRFYNRLLTADEMIHNQRVDNKRFKLGLTI